MFSLLAPVPGRTKFRRGSGECLKKEHCSIAWNGGIRWSVLPRLVRFPPGLMVDGMEVVVGETEDVVGITVVGEEGTVVVVEVRPETQLEWKRWTPFQFGQHAPWETTRPTTTDTLTAVGRILVIRDFKCSIQGFEHLLNVRCAELIVSFYNWNRTELKLSSKCCYGYTWIVWE